MNRFENITISCDKNESVLIFGRLFVKAKQVALLPFLKGVL